MGHEAHVDHPGEITWYVGHGPAPVLGPCPHTGCGHHSTQVVAWGPDLQHYELVACGSTRSTEPGRCNGQCRGWVAQQEGSNAVGTLWGLQAVDLTREHHTTREERAEQDARIAAEREQRQRAAAWQRYEAQRRPSTGGRPVKDAPQA